MGGKALLDKMPEVKRLNRTEWNKVSAEVVRILARHFGIYPHYVRAIPALQGKESFGDVDILLADSFSKKVYPEDSWKQGVAKALGSTAVVTHPNSDMVSVDYLGHQIDVILTTAGDLEMASNYYGYGGVGNLIGKLARKVGFRFKPTGLYMKMYDGADFLGEQMITSNFYECLLFLGLNYNNFGYGFRKEEDVYKFMATGKFFQKETFTDDLNHKDRARDMKSPLYAGFLEYIAKPEVVNQYDFANGTPPFVKTKLKKDYPNTLKLYQDKVNSNRFDKTVRSRFNGDRVQEVTGLKQGLAVGEFMTAFKSGYADQEFKNFVLGSSEKSLRDAIKSFYDKWIVEYEKAQKIAFAKLKREADKAARAKKEVSEAESPSVALA